MGERVLVINLTRFGDLLQTQGLIDDLAIGGKRPSLLCLDNFSQAAAWLRGLEQVWTLPGASLLASLDSSWKLALDKLLRLIRSINESAPPAHVVSLTPSLPGRLLASLAARSGAKITGFGLDEHGYSLNHGLWASFASAAAAKRVNAPFNLSDMFRKMAEPLSGGLGGSPALAQVPREASGWARDFLQSAAPAGAQGFAAFQPGASEERRRWQAQNFGELGRILWDKARLCPVYIGSASEAALIGQCSPGAPFVNAIGKTDFVQLGAILRQCRLLITNDTGSMHLAAGLGTPSLAFFLASAQPWDTGPLLSGCCCLEPDLACHPCQFGSLCANSSRCQSIISPELAGNLVLGWLERGDWRDGLRGSPLHGCRAWLTERDAAGMMRLVPLGGATDSENSRWLGLMREFWSGFFARLRSAESGISSEAGTLSAPGDADGAARVLKMAAATLEAVGVHGQSAASSPKAAQFLLRNCERLQTLLDDCPRLGSIAAFWRECRQNQNMGIDAFLPFAACLKDRLLWLAARLEASS